MPKVGENPKIEVRDEGDKRRVLILVEATDGALGSGIDMSQTTLNIAYDGGVYTLRNTDDNTLEELSYFFQME